MKGNQAEIAAAVEKSKSDFEHVLGIALASKNAAAGTRTDLSGVIADTLMLRCWLTGMSINQLLHPTATGNFLALSFPDWPSIASLSRSIFEGYLALFSLTISPRTKEDRELRLLWWNWHEINGRARSLDLVGSKNPEVANIRLKLKETKKKLQAHSQFSRIPKDLRETFEKGKRPYRALLERPRQISKNAGIIGEHFEAHYQFMSEAAHSQPFVIGMLRRHEPQDTKMLMLLKRSADYATSFLALAVRDFAQMAPKADCVLDARFRNIVAIWSGVYATPFKRV